jgi:hypothetical protein
VSSLGWTFNLDDPSPVGVGDWLRGLDGAAVFACRGARAANSSGGVRGPEWLNWFCKVSPVRSRVREWKGERGVG